MNFTIIKAEKGDIPIIKAIVNSAFSKYIERIGRPPAPMTVDLNQLIQASDLYVLRIGDKLVGSVSLTVDNDSVKIGNLVVDPLSQGQGLGGKLMRFCEEYALKRGYTALTLLTNVKMHENLAIYRKAGFIETEKRFEDGFERVHLRKELL
jgi:ribosomal protein S18 acetylase RimI-like enzyme